jgi:hypothetical protein
MIHCYEWKRRSCSRVDASQSTNCIMCSTGQAEKMQRTSLASLSSSNLESSIRYKLLSRRAKHYGVQSHEALPHLRRSDRAQITDIRFARAPNFRRPHCRTPQPPTSPPPPRPPCRPICPSARFEYQLSSANVSSNAAPSPAPRAHPSPRQHHAWHAREAWAKRTLGKRELRRGVRLALRLGLVRRRRRAMLGRWRRILGYCRIR